MNQDSTILYRYDIVAPSGAFSIWPFTNWKDFWAVRPSVRLSVRPQPVCCLSAWLTCVPLENLSEI